MLAILKDAKACQPGGREIRREWMRQILKELNRNERLLMLLYYYSHRTMKEIGVTLGLSQSRVSQMHSEVIARLKKLHGGRERELRENLGE